MYFTRKLYKNYPVIESRHAYLCLELAIALIVYRVRSEGYIRDVVFLG